MILVKFWLLLLETFQEYVLKLLFLMQVLPLIMMSTLYSECLLVLRAILVREIHGQGWTQPSRNSTETLRSSLSGSSCTFPCEKDVTLFLLYTILRTLCFLKSYLIFYWDFAYKLYYIIFTIQVCNSRGTST